MKNLRTTKRFRKDLKRGSKRGYDLNRLDPVLDLLREGDELPEQYRDHALKGDWAGSRECHLAPDWLLVYDCTEDEVVLLATGTHADIFE